MHGLRGERMLRDVRHAAPEVGRLVQRCRLGSLAPMRGVGGWRGPRGRDVRHGQRELQAGEQQRQGGDDGAVARDVVM